ncbi:MAG: c-type cytochrome [Burkholderiaceae bacterium]|nr:c-type cytochrome [Burkholderiaceae bacterium]
MKSKFQHAVQALALSAAFLTLGVGSAMAQAGAQPWHNIGRDAKPAEIRAWDIDVRPDFKGLPRGSGSVALGETVWEAQCASCHGIFGESNEVFTPIVGGTTPQDILTGRVRNLLADSTYPQRTTMMKLPTISTLWDYINRAMPWQAPKSLSVEEVYGTVAYILYLSDVVPNDFVLSHENIAEVQQRIPNRNGMVFFEPLWRVDGRGDVQNVACMRNCPTEAQVRSALPDFARNAHGNIQEQNRVIGPVRGADTLRPAPEAPLTQRISIAPVVVGMASDNAGGAGAEALALLNANACMACHGVTNSLIGPSFADIAARNRGREGVEAYLMDKIKNGASGVYGAIPMPPQPQVSEADARAIAAWIAAGASAR